MYHSPALSKPVTLQRLYGPEARQVFMGIYNNFLLTAGDAPEKSLLVCSANLGEGATTVALGLATAAAEAQGQPVLLIDGNFSHPEICSIFGLPELYGFGDLLAGRIDAKSMIKPSPIPNLQVMEAGVAPLNHVKMLESPALKNLLDRLAAVYALIIIDGSPINAFPESVFYAAQVDRVLLVVHAGITRVQVVSTALSKLKTGGCRKIDLILNRRTFPIPPWIYRRL